MQNLQIELAELLKNEENLVIDGQLNKNKVIELTLKLDSALIRLLLQHETFRTHFFVDVDGILVFDKIAFQRFVNNKSFLPDSYTAFKNKIGLTINDGSTDNYLTTKEDVVLVWPHKDCVLEGGQTKEDQGRNEIFWNETLAPNEVDRLLNPKVLTNWKKYDEAGTSEVENFNDSDNLIVKGNNLIVISSLKKRYQGKIKLIYIDPPYNTGSDSFQYNDNFNHSTWLTFMKNRLEIARELLSINGTIAISIDNNEIAYVLILLDEIFGRENRKNIITVKRGSVTGAKVINPGVVNVAEYVVIYSRDFKSWRPNRVLRGKERDTRYNQYIVNIQSPPEKWKFSTLLDVFAAYKGVKKSTLKKLLGDSHEFEIEKFIYENKERVIRLAALDDNSVSAAALELKNISKEDDSKIYSLEREDGKPYYLYKGELLLFAKDRLTEIDGKLTFGELLTDIWDDVLPNDLHNEGGIELRKGKKPEKLISRIIELFTSKGDRILDFFIGSGTTAAVAHKLNRQFIGVEQLDYIEELPVKRILNTIRGEQSGISKLVNWSGGGSFVYCELRKTNEIFIDKIKHADTKDELIAIWNNMLETATLSYQFDKKTFNERLAAFGTASIEYMKFYLTEILDKNQLYVNLSEMNDNQFAISVKDKDLNRQFYTRGL